MSLKFCKLGGNCTEERSSTILDEAGARARLAPLLAPAELRPDYLDPQLLGAAAGRPCRNLDLPLCSTTWVNDCFQSFGGNADLALVEGVMGLYDGIGPTSEGSSAAVAKLLNLPVVLVVARACPPQSSSETCYLKPRVI